MKRQLMIAVAAAAIVAGVAGCSKRQQCVRPVVVHRNIVQPNHEFSGAVDGAVMSFTEGVPGEKAMDNKTGDSYKITGIASGTDNTDGRSTSLSKSTSPAPRRPPLFPLIPTATKRTRPALLRRWPG